MNPQEAPTAGQGDEGNDQNPEGTIMTIISETDEARQQRPARPRYVQCARGVELQRAREAAGMDHMQAARRMILVWNLRSPGRNGSRAADDFTARDEAKIIPTMARHIKRLERTSQDAFDRAAAESARRSADMDYCKTIRGGTWRPWPEQFDEPLALISLAHIDATVDDLREALASFAAKKAEADRANDLRALRERGASIARLVWNHAEDSQFLDQALFEELRESPGGGYTTVRGASNYLVRSVLAEIAHELRVTFPDRPTMDIAA